MHSRSEYVFLTMTALPVGEQEYDSVPLHVIPLIWFVIKAYEVETTFPIDGPEQPGEKNDVTSEPDLTVGGLPSTYLLKTPLEQVPDTSLWLGLKLTTDDASQLGEENIYSPP